MSLAKNRVISIFVIFAFLLQISVPDASACWWKGLPHRSPEVEGGTGEGAGGTDDDKANQEGKADDVYLHNGDFVYQHQDLFIPSRGIDVDITRIYKSQSRFNGRFGLGWELSYNKRIVPLSNGDLFYFDGKGGRDRFSYLDGTEYVSPPEVFDEMVQNQDGTYTLTKKDGTKYNFSQNGTLSEIVDRNNNKLTFFYDSGGKLPITGVPLYTNDPITPRLVAYQFMLTKIRDTIGREINFTYDENGRLAKITDFTAREVRYSYDDLGHLTQATDPLGNTIQYSYDDDRNLRSITDPESNTFLTNTYNPNDRVITQEFGDGTFYFSYDMGNKITDFTDRMGNTWVYYFDKNGNPTKIIDPCENETIKTYDTNNRMLLTSITYPKENSILYEYDNKGNLTKITRKPIPDSTEPDSVTNFTYEPNFNQIKTITDPEGNVTTYDYDTKGNLIEVTYPTVGEVTPEAIFTYDSFGQVETTVDPNDNITKYEYYPDTGYLRKTIPGFGTPAQAETLFGYDIRGNVTSITDPRENTTIFTYDMLNQLTQTTSPTPFNYMTKYTYDKNGNLTKIERETNNPLSPWQTTTYTYTILDRIETITDDLGNTTTFSYDANDNKTSIQDAEGNTTTYLYDERNLLWKVTDALSNTTEYTYDGNKNLVEIKDANSNKTTYAYDDFDRLITTTYSDATTEDYTYDKASNLIGKINRRGNTITYVYDELNRLVRKTTPEGTIDYVYDTGSRLTSVTDSSGAIAYVYDALNRVTSVTYPGAKSVSYEYDTAGNRTKLTYPDSTYITYEYDQVNRLKAIKDETSNAITSYNYDGLSRRTNASYLNGTSANYTYDAVSRLTELVNNYNPTPQTYIYTYDRVGNRLTKADSSGTETYTYDDIYQVTNVVYPDTTSITYNYDNLGNRTSVVNGGTVSYAANNLNQYASVGGTTYTYDANGNLTSDGTNTYTYDSESRLITATTPSHTATYTYDPFGRRISKTVDGITTKYLYNGTQVICEYDNIDTLIRKFVYSRRIDEPILIENTQAGETYYYHFDGLGSVTGITDSNGSIVEKYNYDVYGNITIKDASDNPLSESAVGNPYAFTGRRLDTESGVYYYRARYYNQKIGRFLETDPIGYWGGLNLYLYCSNNSINFIDPFGLKIRIARDPKKQKDKEADKIKEDIEELKSKSKTAKEVLDELERSEKEYTIKPTKGGNAYNPSKDEIEYNPNKDHIYDGEEDWHNRPPEVGLGHELIHALHDDRDDLGKTRKEEEEKTVGLGKYSQDPHTENQIRKDYGLPRRPRYER